MDTDAADGPPETGSPTVSPDAANEEVTSALDGFVKGNYPDFATLLSSQSSGSTSGLVLIRRMLAEIRKHEVRRILMGNPFTVGIILAYFLLKREELRKIRKLLIAKQYGRQAESIGSMT